MSESLFFLQEPDLEFASGQASVSPHDGLALFGPYDGRLPHHPASLSYGIVGTDEGLATAASFFDAITGPLRNESRTGAPLAPVPGV